MKIFIAGCARSGTDLTRNLMGCFADTCVRPSEAPAAAFDTEPLSAKNLVIKRTHNSYLTLPDLSSKIQLIYCVRHPYDCLTSTHRQTRHLRQFHVTPDRWLGEYAAFHKLREQQPKRRIFILRYEDLVSRPDEMQEQLSRHFGLVASCRFTDNPEKRPISTASVEKWKSQPGLFSYFHGFPPELIAQINVFCREFKYEIPSSQGSTPSRRD